MWSSLTLSDDRPGRRDLLETLLARSGGVPFEFAWTSFTVPIPDAVLDAIIHNMDRIGSFTCRSAGHGAHGRLLEHNAPALRCLRMNNSTVTLSADWGPHMAPRLEVLELDGLTIPRDFQPLSALTSLSVLFKKGSSIPALSKIFPRLVTLRLGGVTEAVLKCLGAPPPSCSSVTLKSARGIRNPVDYAPFLSACYSLRLPYLSISGANTIAPYVQEFVHSTKGQYRMSIDAATLDCKEGAIVRHVDAASGSRLPIREEASCFLYLDRLCDLSLSAELLFDLYALQPAGETFPALHSLMLLLDPQTDEAPSILATGKGAPLRMPLLTAVTLGSHTLDSTDLAHIYSVTVEFPRLLPALIAGSTNPLHLDSLTVILPSENDAAEWAASPQNLCDLRGLAGTLRVMGWEEFHRIIN